MMYTIEYSKDADKTLRKWKKSNPRLFKKATKSFTVYPIHLLCMNANNEKAQNKNFTILPFYLLRGNEKNEGAHHCDPSFRFK